METAADGDLSRRNPHSLLALSSPDASKDSSKKQTKLGERLPTIFDPYPGMPGAHKMEIARTVLEVSQPDGACSDLPERTFACLHRLPGSITYQAFALQWSKVVEDDIVEHCKRSNPYRDIISQVIGGGAVVRIGDAVVKCGLMISHLEAWNLKYAQEIIPATIIHIPQVYYHFSRGLYGYLIMEYVSGQPLSSVEDPDIYLEPVAKILQQFEQIQQSRPGPFHGGAASGRFWLDYDPPVLTTISDVEEYYNTRQLKRGPQIKLCGYRLSFCHLDIAPRNIVVQEQGSLCFVDWKTGGFYPRLFERVSLQMNRRGETDWNSKLLKLLDELDEGEKNQGLLLMRAAHLAVRSH